MLFLVNLWFFHFGWKKIPKEMAPKGESLLSVPASQELECQNEAMKRPVAGREKAKIGLLRQF